MASLDSSITNSLQQKKSEILTPAKPLRDILSRGLNRVDSDWWNYELTVDMLQEISTLLSVPINNLLFFYGSGEVVKERKVFLKEYVAFYTIDQVFILPCFLQQPEGDEDTVFYEKHGVNRLKALNIRCSKHKSITFNYTAETTVMDLTEYIEREYKIPKSMQIVYSKNRVRRPSSSIVEILLAKRPIDWEINYDFPLAVKFPIDSSDETQLLSNENIKKICVESDFTILKTITVKFINGQTFCVIDLSTVNIESLRDVDKYIENNMYEPKFSLYCENDIKEKYAAQLLDPNNHFLDIKSKSFARDNFNMIFVPDFDSAFKNNAFLDLHKGNLTQQIRLVFITKEETISTNQRINVNNLKVKIKEQFGYTPDQQTLFYHKRQLEGKEFLTELSMEQEGDLVIKVIVSKPKIVEVHVLCSFRLQNGQPLQFTITDVEENLLVKDLQEMIQNRIQHQEPVVIKEADRERHLEDNTMICDIPKIYYSDTPNPSVRIAVHKFFTISFHEKYRRIRTNTKTGNEIYIVRNTNKTIKMMLDEFEHREKKRYKLHPTMNYSSSVTKKKFTKKTKLNSLDSGSIIHVKDKRDREENNCFSL